MITRIEALNYKGLRYITQGIAPFQVLVGPNASGKSTFLDVVALLGDFVRNGVDSALLFGEEGNHGRARSLDELIFNQSADCFELAVEVRLPKSVVEERHNGNPQYTDARYEVRFGRAPSGEMEIGAETLWLFDSQRPSRPTRTAPPFQQSLFPAEPDALGSLIAAGHSRPGWRKVVNKVARSGNDYFKAETTDWNIMFRTQARKAALASLPEDHDRFPASIWVRNLLLDGVRAIALNSAAMRRPVSPSSQRRFSVNGANLPLVVQDLRQPHRDDWLKHLRNILPGLRNVEVREQLHDRHLYLALHYDAGGEPVPAWLISDGTLRILALTLIPYTAESPSVYLVEEPENGIHPKALEGVYQSLSSVYDGQVLVASHSPLLLGLATPSDLLCFARNPSGAVAVVRGDKHPALREWQGEVDIETLYASGVLG